MESGIRCSAQQPVSIQLEVAHSKAYELENLPVLLDCDAEANLVLGACCFTPRGRHSQSQEYTYSDGVGIAAPVRF
jgi:hypothetical protein